MVTTQKLENICKGNTANMCITTRLSMEEYDDSYKQNAKELIKK